jgi:hypothetical protein
VQSVYIILFQIHTAPKRIRRVIYCLRYPEKDDVKVKIKTNRVFVHSDEKHAFVTYQSNRLFQYFEFSIGFIFANPSQHIHGFWGVQDESRGNLDVLRRRKILLQCR